MSSQSRALCQITYWMWQVSLPGVTELRFMEPFIIFVLLLVPYPILPLLIFKIREKDLLSQSEEKVSVHSASYSP